MSELEDVLAFQIKVLGLLPVEREYRFYPARRWRADFAYPELKILIECEGGTWVRGAHTRGAHFEKDCEKYNAAAMAGWLVLRFTTDMIKDGRAISQIEVAHRIQSGK
jgi:very-short-patch-repair endonuclease